MCWAHTLLENIGAEIGNKSNGAEATDPSYGFYWEEASRDLQM